MKEENINEMDKILRQKFSEFEGRTKPSSKEKVFATYRQLENASNEKSFNDVIKEYFFKYAVAASILLAILIGLYWLYTISVTKTTHVSGISNDKKDRSKKTSSEKIILPIQSKEQTSLNKKSGSEWVSFRTKEKISSTILPDNSRVFLNRNSSLKYSGPDFNEKGREVYLAGEAYFDVEGNPQKPFVIHTSRSTIEVIGTSFNVRTSDTSEEIIVEEGKVSFASNESRKSIILTKGTKGILNEEHRFRQVRKINLNELSWKTNKLVFSKTPMEEVIAEIERYFGIEIEVGDVRILKCRYTGVFENPSKEKVMEIIALSIHGTFKEKNNKYLLTGKGCK